MPDGTRPCSPKSYPDRMRNTDSRNGHGFYGTETVHPSSLRYSFNRRYGAYFNGRSISLDDRTTGRMLLKRSKLDRP